MKVLRPAEEREVCDLCGADAYLQQCTVCGKMFCLVCDGVVPASWNFTTLCKRCADREDVQKCCEEYAKRLTPIFKAREVALRKLGKRK